MSSQRPSFAKRDREMKLKDRARAKAERRAARRAEPRTGSGPPIAGLEESVAPPPAQGGADSTSDTPPPPAVPHRE